jgi:two-component system chemotaxis sensor kinase CheA
MVIDNPDLKGLDLQSFPRAAAYLSKITRELQAVTMSIRMIPLEGLFSKMQRLVRDLGRKFGKDIELEISGAETEMDRNIIEEISDPLVHIIRNAIDHGIEDDDVRKTKGKTAGGKIRLNARYEGNEIWITIADDGAGLNRDRILEVARTKGLGGSEPLTDPEVWKLIFEPGFSTAKEVSEISGRGVGMDVVKKNLEKLRGQIDISSVKDQGTDFVLKIPLTLAILDGVTLRSGTTLFSIPIADVVEFQNFQPDRVTRTDPNHQVLRLRDEVMPVLPLTDIFVPAGGTAGQKPGAKQVSIIVRSQTRKLALIVDEIVGYKQIVLKALPESMAGLAGISGCTILGNGEVSLIIDVNAVFQRYLA